MHRLVGWCWLVIGGISVVAAPQPARLTANKIIPACRCTALHFNLTTSWESQCWERFSALWEGAVAAQYISVAAVHCSVCFRLKQWLAPVYVLLSSVLLCSVLFSSVLLSSVWFRPKAVVSSGRGVEMPIRREPAFPSHRHRHHHTIHFSSSLSCHLNHFQSLINHSRIMPDPSYEITPKRGRCLLPLYEWWIQRQRQ